MGTRAYGWSSSIEGGDKRRLYALLDVPPVNSPDDSVGLRSCGLPNWLDQRHPRQEMEMPIYRLRRIADGKVFDDEDARDDEHALAVFGQRLGVTLTLEGPAAPEYMMGRIEKEPHWAKPEQVPVYEAGESSN